MRSTLGVRLPLQQSRSRACLAKASAVTGSDIPRSLEAAVSQAALAIRSSVFGDKRGKKKRVKSIRRLWVEIPTLDTSVDKTLFLTAEMLEALQSDGRTGASVVYGNDDYCETAQKRFTSNTVVHIDDALDVPLDGRLLIFNPTARNEAELFELLDDHWRGEVVLLFNPEFSDEFKEKQKAFVNAFDTVYCFMPLAVKIFIQNKDGALFRWQKERGVDAKWLIFLEENQEFKQIGQQATRPSQQQLETALYNATAVESPITKGLNFLGSFGKKK